MNLLFGLLSLVYDIFMDVQLLQMGLMVHFNVPVWLLNFQRVLRRIVDIVQRCQWDVAEDLVQEVIVGWRWCGGLMVVGDVRISVVIKVDLLVVVGWGLDVDHFFMLNKKS